MIVTDAQVRAALEVVIAAMLRKGGVLAMAARRLQQPTPEVIEVVRLAIEAALESRS